MIEDDTLVEWFGLHDMILRSYYATAEHLGLETNSRSSLPDSDF